MDKPKNHPPALSTDPGCEHCYRGRELIDVVLGTPVEPDKRTYGATWQLCRFCVASPSLVESPQAQPTSPKICTKVVHTSTEGLYDLKAIMARDRIASSSQDISWLNQNIGGADQATRNIQRAYMDRHELLRRLTLAVDTIYAAVEAIPDGFLSKRADLLARLTEIEQ